MRHIFGDDCGASLTRTVASNVAQGLQLGTDLTGIDLGQLLAKLAGARAENEPNGDKKTARSTLKQVTGEAKPAD